MTTVPSYPDAQRVRQLRVLRSEWTKLRSVRSTAWSALATVALLVGIGVLICTLRAARPASEVSGNFDPAAMSLTGVHLAQFAIGVLGVLVVTGEYATGTIRTSLAAVPRRLPLLWGKVATIAVLVLATCLPGALVAFVVGQSILAPKHLDVGLSDPGVLRAVIGSALYLTAVGLLGLSLGALLRNTTGSVAALFGVLFAPQIVAAFLPSDWSDAIVKYMPEPAGTVITNAQPDPASLGPWTGLGLFCGYIAVVLALAAWQLRRRDA
jgi:ABC-2 type transport system permease protein